MAKKNYFKSLMNQNDVYNQTVHMLRNKYFNLYRAQFKWTGIDYRQEKYIMRKFWDTGTIAAFKDKNVDEILFAPWAQVEHDMYGLPEKVNLINEFGSPLVPTKVQVVDKDVVLGWIQRNEKGVGLIANWYIERIAQVEMVINTNLQLHKMPFLIPVEDDDTKVEDAVRKILNNELVLFVKGVDPNLFTAVATGAPYIIDKLTDYKNCLENELKTYLSIDNSNVAKVEQLQMSEVNANNAEINDSETNFLDSLNEWCDNIQETLGISISVESTSEPVEFEGQIHEGDTPGPKEESDNE